MLPAAAPGFSPGDTYVLGLLFAGIAVFAAVGALSHQQDRAFSASLIYLVLGLAAAFALELFGVAWLDPVEDSGLFEKISEFAVIIALFGTGLKLERELTWRAWSNVVRLLAIAMPLTIGAFVLYGTEVMGLSLGAALALGAVLSPTDPVLAGDLGVGPPGESDESEPNFSVTGEAGFNDGLAFPFVFLAVFVADEGGTDWLGEWLLADVLWAIVAGVGLGALLGAGIAWLAVRLRNRELLSPELDGWLAVAAVLVVYGIVELVGAYGFLAAFTGGLAFRRYERDHEYNERVHTGAEMVEKFSELAVVLLLASAVTFAGLSEPGLSGWLLVPVALLVVRPLAVLISLIGARVPAEERSFVAWFGVRGIGSVYYASVIVGLGVLSDEEAARMLWSVVLCVIGSIIVHGITSAPLTRRWLGSG